MAHVVTYGTADNIAMPAIHLNPVYPRKIIPTDMPATKYRVNPIAIRGRTFNLILYTSTWYRRLPRRCQMLLLLGFRLLQFVNDSWIHRFRFQ